MATTSPIRIDDDVAASARIVASAMSRSAAQQIAHWARIGRALELSPTVTHADIAAVLSGDRHYDSLNAQEQAVVRAEWEHAMTSRREGLNFEAEFADTGRPYSELDADGNVVTITPN